jgi:hypothetical protein
MDFLKDNMGWSGAGKATTPVKGSLLTLDTDSGQRLNRAMPRRLRNEDPGALYHVMHRGGQREEVSRDDGDWQCSIATLAPCLANEGRIMAMQLPPTRRVRSRA